MLFEEDVEEGSSAVNLPTLAGMSVILVGIAYIFQQIGLWGSGIDLTVLAGMLPWLAGLLVVLTGFGVLSWRPGRKRARRKAEKKLAKSEARRAKELKAPGSRKRLSKSRDKKIAGVAGGIAEYFGVDATLVRIALVVGTVVSGGGPLLLAYIILAFAMPSADDPVRPSREERITIIRDS
ncbi:MAG: phage-shock protein [Bacteroidetes bacterium CG12_big_fil_rev_8_21_14_0_65_60_17]|nr:MAG: phage-shock protein [Bacteroidetes bacterium CG12_big_fil_rev_8_21_14_0_65_60_17]